MRMTQRWPPLYGRRAGTPFLPKRFLSENLRMTNACGAAAVDMVRDCGWMGGRHPNGTLYESPTKFRESRLLLVLCLTAASCH